MPAIETPATRRKYWFPAKRYGWGWGLPVVWQGWAILVAFGGLVGAGLFIFPLSTKMGSLLIYWALLTAALMAICWLKGEPPRWRWGDDEGAR